jgi:hypothetical protein
MPRAFVVLPACLVFTMMIAGLRTLPGAQAPSNLFYTPDSFRYSDAILLSWNPTVTGTATAWSVNPPLPASMKLDSTNGKISGVPLAVMNWTTYTITASNASGSTSTSLYVANDGPLAIRPGSFATRLPGDPFAFTLLPEMVPQVERLEMRVLDTRGFTVWRTAARPSQDGVRTVAWQGVSGAGRGVAPGVYVIQVSVQDESRAAPEYFWKTVRVP